MEMKNIIPIKQGTQRLLTQRQLADFYEVKVENIRENFRQNRDRFQEGVHFIKVSGQALRDLKASIEDEIAVRIRSGETPNSFGVQNTQSPFINPVAGATNSIILYTVQGAARHAKMLRNPKAQEAFMALQRDYFNATPQIVTILGVRGYVDDNQIVRLNAEDVSIGLGFSFVATSGNETILRERVNEYLHSFGYDKIVGKDDFLPENMFYRLAMKAKNAKAEEFQTKVADEIMPAIRKQGFYVDKEIFAKRQDKPVQLTLIPEEPKKKYVLSELAQVYVFKLKDGYVKIGHTGDVDNRRAHFSGVKDDFASPKMPRPDARRLERKIHNHFADKKIKGEIYDVPFETVVAEIKKYFPEQKALPDVNTLIEIVKLMEPCPERQQLLVRISNLLNG